MNILQTYSMCLYLRVNTFWPLFGYFEFDWAPPAWILILNFELEEPAVPQDALFTAKYYRSNAEGERLKSERLFCYAVKIMSSLLNTAW